MICYAEKGLKKSASKDNFTNHLLTILALWTLPIGSMLDRRAKKGNPSMKCRGTMAGFKAIFYPFHTAAFLLFLTSKKNYTMINICASEDIHRHSNELINIHQIFLKIFGQQKMGLINCTVNVKTGNVWQKMYLKCILTIFYGSKKS